MLLEVLTAVVTPAYQMVAHPQLSSLGAPVVARASLSIPDTLFLFVVALVVFGPKRLPEIGKQIGKLVFEFRRASNDFKLQIEEELRLSDQQEKQKKLEMQAAAAVENPPLAAQTAAPTNVMKASTVSAPIGELSAPSTPTSTEEIGLVIQPPSSGTMVEAQPPNRYRTEEPVHEAGDAAGVQRVEAGLEQESVAKEEAPATTPADHPVEQHG